MKNVLIGMLSLALCIVAFLTRPTEGDFRAFVRDQAEEQKRRALGAPGRRLAAAAGPSLEKAEFKDCWLWVEVVVDGKSVYAGVFNHWWDRSGRMERA